MNVFDETRNAVKAAELQIKAADETAQQIADILKSRLRLLDTWRGIETLRQMKKELRDFDMVTGRWK